MKTFFRCKGTQFLTHNPYFIELSKGCFPEEWKGGSKRIDEQKTRKCIRSVTIWKVSSCTLSTAVTSLDTRRNSHPEVLIRAVLWYPSQLSPEIQSSRSCSSLRCHLYSALNIPWINPSLSSHSVYTRTHWFLSVSASLMNDPFTFLPSLKWPSGSLETLPPASEKRASGRGSFFSHASRSRRVRGEVNVSLVTHLCLQILSLSWICHWVQWKYKSIQAKKGMRKWTENRTFEVKAAAVSLGMRECRVNKWLTWVKDKVDWLWEGWKNWGQVWIICGCWSHLKERKKENKSKPLPSAEVVSQWYGLD